MSRAPRGTYCPGPREQYRRVKHPGRCNKRACQTRRNLTKHPALYARPPRCREPGCGGLIVVDWYRMNKGPRDLPPACTDEHCPWLEQRLRNGEKFVPFHRVNNKGCSGYEDWKLDRALAASKHCPNKPEDHDQAPF